MKIEVKDLSPVRKSMLVEVEASEVDRETETVVRRYASQVRIPGFRPGKAPRSVVRTRFAKEIEDDVRDRLLSRLYTEAATEQGLRPLSDPVLDEVAFEPGHPFRFKTTFDVAPRFTPKDYRGVDVRQQVAAVGDQEVDEALEELRQNQARLTSEEGRTAAHGDVLLADVEGEPDPGEPFRRERVLVELGAAHHLPEFNERLVGAEAGSKLEFRVTHPADHQPPQLAGTSVLYRIHVHEVKRKQVPALDDEFAKDLGDFEDLEALRARVRQDLETRKRVAASNGVRQALLDKVLLENPVPLPDSLVEEEVRNRLQDLVRSLVLQGVDVEHLDLDWKQLRDGQEEAARRTVHARLVLDAVAVAEGLAIDPDEVDRRIRTEAARLGEAHAAVRSRLEKAGGLEALTNQLLREKTLDFLTSVANIHREE